MGGPTGKKVVQWSSGEYSDAIIKRGSEQDGVQMIANVIGFATDDHGNTANNTATALIVGNNGVLTNGVNKGIIEQHNDVDIFSFVSEAGEATFTVEPYSSIAKVPNLDIKIRLLDASENEIAVSDDPSSLSATITENLSAGTYYLEIDGTGNGTVDTGYSDYGSLGQFSISGSYTLPTTTSDTEAPVITLIGDATINMNVGDSYIEQEATATDNIDDDSALTENIVIGGDTVDTNTPGIYIITYNVSDAASNAAT